MKRLARLVKRHAVKIRDYQESRDNLGNLIADLLRPVISNISCTHWPSAPSAKLFFKADYKYSTYTKERRITLGDVLHDLMPNVTVDEFGDLWITDDEMYEILRILEEAL